MWEDLKVRYILVILNAFLLYVLLHFLLHFLLDSYGKALELDEHLAAKIPVWLGSDCVGFMQLNLKLRWVLRVAKNFIGGSEGTIYSRYFECIPVMFPVYISG